MKRTLAALVGVLALVTATTAVVATHASACVLGCFNNSIAVSPHSGVAGTFPAHLPPPWGNYEVNIVELFWNVTNNGQTAAEVAITSGATGCARLEPPYISLPSTTLDPGDTVFVAMYVTYACYGSGTVYLGAGRDQGSQSITFSSP